MRVATQLARHDLRVIAKTTGGIENTLKVVKARIRPRRHLFANAERTNRLLLLITLEMRGTLDERAWAAKIRADLLARGGRPPNQGQITDPIALGSSLRLKVASP